LLLQVGKRLKQVESFLALHGHRRIEDRLYNLLLLLKQEIGQSAENGTRLSVRLTHEDLASACGTTRVTMTRLLSKFKQENLISLDSQHHLVLHA
jgi:CRP-like cAMP-binding protein